MNCTIAAASGKGGTGKTLLAVNLFRAFSEAEENVRYIDCDVEAANGHLFLDPGGLTEDTVVVRSPVSIDEDRCIACGKCAEVCSYNALAVVAEKVLFFPELCHACGACSIVCPNAAVVEDDKAIGTVRYGYSEPRYAGDTDGRNGLGGRCRRRGYDFCDGHLETAVGGMSPRLIRRLKEHADEGISILDAPPGTACPAVETIRGVDICILVLDPSPFGIHDGALALDMCRESGIEPFIFINRSNYPQEKLRNFISANKLKTIGSLPEDREISFYYSEGKTIFDTMPKYRNVFTGMRDLLFEYINSGRRPAAGSGPAAVRFPQELAEVPDGAAEGKEAVGTEKTAGSNVREIVIVSGKGGTGKTSVTAAFAALSKEECRNEPNSFVFADCDVDASDLHLIFKPQVTARGEFSGGNAAQIMDEKCSSCGACFANCRFDAVIKEGGYRIDEDACEGCGVCSLVCPENAIRLSPRTDGEWYQSRSRFGSMAHARLHTAAENSGRLVTLVRKKKDSLAAGVGADSSLNDGSPGTGCPVIASLTGSHYAIIVTEPTVSGIHDLRRILDLSGHFGIPSGVIINKADINEEKTKEIGDLIEKRSVDFLGRIPFDKSVTEAQIAGLSVVEYGKSPAAQAIREIWEGFKDRL